MTVQARTWNVITSLCAHPVSRNFLAAGPVIAMGEGWKRLRGMQPNVWMSCGLAPQECPSGVVEVWAPERHAAMWPMSSLYFGAGDEDIPVTLLEDGHVRDIAGIARPAPFVALVAEECMKRGATKVLFYGAHLDGGKTTDGIVSGNVWYQLRKKGLEAGVQIERLKPTMVTL